MSGQADLFGIPPAPERPPSRHSTDTGAPRPFVPPVPEPGFAFRDAPRPASERQASFAADISRGLGIPLPIGTDALEVGGFIERHRQEYQDELRRRGGRRRP